MYDTCFKMEGFFVECGAYDGETISNTLFLERVYKWSGLLVEANMFSFSKLIARRRRAHAIPACVSLKPYPMKVNFTLSSLQSAIDSRGSNESEGYNPVHESKTAVRSEVQCFPMYSFLMAVNRTRLDYLSLDVEGHDLKVLETIPWHLVDIKVSSLNLT